MIPREPIYHVCYRSPVTKHCTIACSSRLAAEVVAAQHYRATIYATWRTADGRVRVQPLLQCGAPVRREVRS